MRAKRIRIDTGDRPGTYYHIYNRIAGQKSDRPFGDVEKDEFVRRLLKQAAGYALELITYCVMGNHYHLVVFAPNELPTKEFAEVHWQLLSGDRPPPVTDAEWLAFRERLRDFSDFTKILQQSYTCWFNRTHPSADGEPRRGGLWSGRFKSTVLEGARGTSAVWGCVEYIELNPVRANIVADPAAYRFCSWGRYCGSGHHPCAETFVNHLRRLRGHEADDWTDADTFAAMRAELARAIAADNSGTSGEIAAAAEFAKKEPAIWVRADRRIRYWCDGAVVGTKAFVASIFADRYGPERAERHRYATGSADPGGPPLTAMRRPQHR